LTPSEQFPHLTLDYKDLCELSLKCDKNWDQESENSHTQMTQGQIKTACSCAQGC